MRMDATLRSVRRPMVAFAAVATLFVVTAVAAGGPAGGAPPTTVGSASADLAVTLSSTPASVRVNEFVTYTAKVTNAGPDAAAKVTFVDGLTNVGSLARLPVTSAGSCSGQGNYNTVSCDLGTVRAGATVTVRFAIQVYSGGVITDSAGIASATPDPVSANDTASTNTVVVPPPPYERVVVDGYFSHLLGRLPTDAERAIWVPRFQSHPFVDFVRLLTSTTRYRQRWLDRQFRAYLGRPVGAADGTLLRWLQQGRSYDDVVAAIVASEEFVTHQFPACQPGRPCTVASLTKDFWVRTAYRALTGDQIPDGLAASLQSRLDAGESRATVAHAILVLPEARRRFVDGITRTFLHRRATNFELYLNIASMLKGQRPEATEASMFASLAFIAAFVPSQPVCCVPVPLTALPVDG